MGLGLRYHLSGAAHDVPACQTLLCAQHDTVSNFLPVVGPLVVTPQPHQVTTSCNLHLYCTYQILPSFHKSPCKSHTVPVFVGLLFKASFPGPYIYWPLIVAPGLHTNVVNFTRPQSLTFSAFRRIILFFLKFAFFD